MKKLTKLLAMVLAVSMIGVLFAGCGSNEKAEETAKETETTSDLAYLKEKGKMTIGYTTYDPMNYKNDDGELIGFDTEFAQAVCKKLGIEADFVEIEWDNKFLELESKGIDCIWNGMTITDEVTNNAMPTKPYVKNAQVVVCTKDNAEKFSDKANLKDIKFAAEAGSAGEKAIKENGFDKNLTSVTAQTDALLEVKSGSADACVIDLTMAKAMTGEGTSYENLVTTVELTTEEYGVAFRKNSDMPEKVNAIMDELKADGTLDELAEKYGLILAF